MIIKVGDKVEIKRGFNPLLRDGIIKDINISTNAETDPAGENGPSVKELNLSLNYAGSITYEDVTFGQNGDMHWAYFGQIKQNA